MLYTWILWFLCRGGDALDGSAMVMKGTEECGCCSRFSVVTCVFIFVRVGFLFYLFYCDFILFYLI